MKRFKSSSCNAVFSMILIFARLQVFFNIFFLKLRVKWKRLRNSGKSFEFNVFYLKWFILFLLEMVIFPALFPRWPTLLNSTLKKTTLIRRCLTFLASTLKYTTLIRCCPMLRIPVLKCTTMIWGSTTSRRHINQKTMLKQRWNVCWVTLNNYLKNINEFQLGKG